MLSETVTGEWVGYSSFVSVKLRPPDSLAPVHAPTVPYGECLRETVAVAQTFLCWVCCHHLQAGSCGVFSLEVSSAVDIVKPPASFSNWNGSLGGGQVGQGVGSNLVASATQKKYCPFH